MCVLGSEALFAKLRSGEIFCSPKIEDVQLQGSHIDVRLGRWYYTPSLGYLIRHGFRVDLATLDPSALWKLRDSHDTGGQVIIPPWGPVLAHTEEFLGSTVCHLQTKLETRSSIARSYGIGVHTAAGQGDPGFHGRWTLEIWSSGWGWKTIPVGVRVGCVMFSTVLDNTVLYTDRYQTTPATWAPQTMLPRPIAF
jgi:deoxycytidine triphosphate deaminase